MNYLGHDFYKCEESLYRFRCKNCNIEYFKSEYIEYFIIVELNINTIDLISIINFKITCDEMIIKNIIE